MTLQVPVCSISIRKSAKISFLSVKIAKIFSGGCFFYLNLGEPLITISIFHFLQKQRGVLSAKNTANCNPSNFFIVLRYSDDFAAQLIISVAIRPIK